MAKDIIHDAVKNALIKDGWLITADPYRIEYEEFTLFADLAAEREIKGHIVHKIIGEGNKMDKSIHYQAIIKTFLSNYANLMNSQPVSGLETVLSFDDEHHQYMLLKVGWPKDSRIHHVIIHVALRNDKIWIETDWTEEGIATYFLDQGIPNQDIVLGFQSPTMRPFTEFAVA